MTNINNDISKFDGKYLKCVVAKSKGVTKYLANSGSMIVLQPYATNVKANKQPKYNINRNYVYLGDEFLASGYGFSTEENQFTGERIVKTYDDTIKSLQKADESEQIARSNADEKIIKKFDEYVAIEGGDISKTIAKINNYKIPTRDLLLHGEEFQYKNLEVESYKIYVNDNLVVGNKLLYPIGKTISKLDIEIITKDHHSGGLEKLYILHDFNSRSEDGTKKYEEGEGIIINYDFDYDNIITDSEYDTDTNNSIDSHSHKFVYKKTLPSMVVDTTPEVKLIKKIYLYVKETPASKYQYYPGLYNISKNKSDGPWKITSPGNAIKPNRIEIDYTLSIIPQYYVKCVFNTTVTSENLIDIFINKTINSYDIALNNIYDNLYNNDILLKLNQITDVGNRDFKSYILVPSNFSLRKYYLTNNNFSEKYNVTGGVKKTYAGIMLPIQHVQNSTDNKFYCVSYDIYELSSDKPLIDNTNIELNIVYNYGTNDIFILNETQLKQSFNNQKVTYNSFINDEEFNQLYWVDINTDIDANHNEISERLSRNLISK